jgi:inosine-uridine nucleoside N-ribohydrolase
MPGAQRTRVIIDTDAKNEADDQFAIVHALLTPSFELHGIVPAHFGSAKSQTSLQDSHDEVMLLLRLMALEGQVRVADGAAAAIPDARTPAPSPGAELIVAEALKDDPRRLHVAFLGPLTDMASALLLAPEIAGRDVRVIWIGGGHWPVGNREYNLSNDIAAANVVVHSGIELWQIPMPVYRRMAVVRRTPRARRRPGRGRQVPRPYVRPLS